MYEMFYVVVIVWLSSYLSSNQEFMPCIQEGKKGFTLVELAIVLVIIGLITRDGVQGARSD